MGDNTNRPPAGEWDAYWRGVGSGPALSGGGVSDPVIQAFWNGVFTAVRDRYANPRILDVGTGSGAVVEEICRVFGADLPPLICLDISGGAVRAATQRWPSVLGVIADARAIPLASGSINVAISQFGVEYAGLAAIREMLRTLAPGGHMALVIHHRSGGIFKECQASLNAAQRIREAQFFPLALEMFESGFAACRGGDRRAYEAAAQRFQPSLDTLEAIMAEHGRHVAGDTVLRLYDDVKRIQQRMPHYDPSEVRAWLRRMDDELHLYAVRMKSMCDSAVDEQSFGRLCDNMRDLGYGVDCADALRISGHPLPIAWSLILTGA